MELLADTTGSKSEHGCQYSTEKASSVKMVVASSLYNNIGKRFWLFRKLRVQFIQPLKELKFNMKFVGCPCGFHLTHELVFTCNLKRMKSRCLLKDKSKFSYQISIKSKTNIPAIPSNYIFSNPMLQNRHKLG